MKKTILLLLLSFLTIETSWAQKEGYIGIFGNGVGLDFNPSPPEVIVPQYKKYEEFEALEGCAAISDKNGNLLFYTNGVSVWNKMHEIMENGASLTGITGINSAFSTTQTLIVPFPKDPYLYYVFSIGHHGGSLRYSTVDMHAFGGLGRVVLVGEQLYENASEKMCVVKNGVGDKLWLITHQHDSDAFRAFLIDEHGVNKEFVESKVGEIHVKNRYEKNGSTITNSNAIGYLKASPNGKILASAIDGLMGVLEIFDFDHITGIVSNARKLFENPEKGSYGVEFSPDGSLLYQSCYHSKELFQYNLSAGSTQDIKNSAQLISDDVSSALQLGPDGKIYIVGTEYGEFLDRINNPNALGPSCNFEKNVVYLRGVRSWMGLPEFSHRLVEPEILFSNLCANAFTLFELGNPEGVTAVLWNFGDPAAGNANLSTSFTPRHQYIHPGNYLVQVEVTLQNQETKTYQKEIKVYKATVELGKDTTLCPGTRHIHIIPQVSGDNLKYKWQNGSTSPDFYAYTPGKYWVEVNDGYCTISDTILVKEESPPFFILEDRFLCHGESIQLELNKPGVSYLWENGMEGGFRLINKSGKYKLTGTNICGSYTKEFTVTISPKLQLDLPEEIYLCKDEVFTADASFNSAQYRWQDGSTNPVMVIQEEGTYWVEIYNDCEILTDSIQVHKIKVDNLFFPNVITPNGDPLNEFFKIDERLIGSRIKIFNRWGKEVYFSSNYQNDWNAEGQNPGTFYYILEENCSQKKLKGYIQVLK